MAKGTAKKETNTTKAIVDALPKVEVPQGAPESAAVVAPAIPTEDLMRPLQVVTEDGKTHVLDSDGHSINTGKQPTSEKTEIEQSIPAEVGKPAKKIKMLRQDGNLELHNGVTAAKRQVVTVPKFVQEVPDSSGLESRKGKTIKREDR